MTEVAVAVGGIGLATGVDVATIGEAGLVGEGAAVAVGTVRLATSVAVTGAFWHAVASSLSGLM